MGNTSRKPRTFNHQESRDEIFRASQLSQKYEIEALELQINFPVQFLFNELIPIHQSLENTPIKSYTLKIASKATFENPTVLDLCSQLAPLQSLEKLELYLPRIYDAMVLQALFEKLPKLKKLFVCIQGEMTNPFGDFPMESLAAMVCLEELTLKLMYLKKANLEKRLPKLPFLKQVNLIISETTNRKRC